LINNIIISLVANPLKLSKQAHQSSSAQAKEKGANNSKSKNTLNKEQQHQS
jgi:hypothetical protein